MKSAAARFPAAAKVAGVVRASELQAAPAQMVSCGIAAVDALTGGLPRGALTEIFGPVSSGRSSLMLATLAEITSRNEACALVDATDAFDPYSAAAAGVNLERLLWVRCRQTSVSRFQFPVSKSRHSSSKLETRNSKLAVLEQALKATDLLLQGGGFGLVIVDLGDVPPQVSRRVPLTSWFRFRRAVEHTQTVLMVIEAEPSAKTCASLVLAVSRQQPAIRNQFSSDDQQAGKDKPAHTRLLRGISVQVEVVRSRVQAGRTPPPLETARKPAQSARTRFESKTGFAI